jgi:hypothetical protein
MPYGLVNIKPLFRRTCCLHLQLRIWRLKIPSKIGTCLPDFMASHSISTQTYIIFTAVIFSNIIIKIKCKIFSVYKHQAVRTCIEINLNLGRAVAQAVSLWLPTAAARVRVQTACGVCCGQSGTGAGFLRLLRVPLPITPPISPLS